LKYKIVDMTSQMAADGADMAFAIDARLAVSMLDRMRDWCNTLLLQSLISIVILL
jgi:hypothetical protein